MAQERYAMTRKYVLVSGIVFGLIPKFQLGRLGSLRLSAFASRK